MLIFAGKQLQVGVELIFAGKQLEAVSILWLVANADFAGKQLGTASMSWSSMSILTRCHARRRIGKSIPQRRLGR